MTGFRALLQLDLRLTFGGPLFRVLVLACSVAAAIAATSVGGAAQNGWQPLASACGIVAPILLAAGAIAGAVSLSGDAADGSLRAVLVRPVDRSAVVMSRAIVLVLASAALYAMTLGVATLAARSRANFGAVSQGSGDSFYEFLSSSEMRHLAASLFTLALPGILCAPLIGLMIGSRIADPAAAAILALVIVLAPGIAGMWGATVPGWLFTGATTESFRTLAELAQGIQTHQDAVASPEFFVRALMAPLVTGVLAVILAIGVFTHRDYHR